MDSKVGNVWQALAHRVSHRRLYLLLGALVLAAVLLTCAAPFGGSAVASTPKQTAGLYSRLLGLERPSTIPMSSQARNRAPESLRFSRDKAAAILSAGNGSISGLVTSTSGAPLEGVEIDVFTLEGDYIGYVLTAANGTYHMPNLPNISVYIATYCAASDLNYIDEWYDNVVVVYSPDAAGATPLDLASQPTRTGIDFQLAPGRTISGTIKDAEDVGVPGAMVEVTSADGDMWGMAPADWNGTYRISGLPGGRYYVGTYNDSGYVDEWYDDVIRAGNYEAAGATIVDLSSGDAANINFVLAPGKSISGHLQDTLGNAIEDAFVDAYDLTGEWAGSGYVDPEGAGAYEVIGLAPGQYHIASSNYSGYVDEWYDNVPVAEDPEGATAATIDVRTDDATGKDFVLGLGRSISGTVTDSSGTPLDEVEVDISDASGHTYWSVWTDRSGRFEVIGLYPGQYKVNTWNDQGYVDEWYDNVNLPGNFEGEGVDLVDVSSADAADVDFELDRGFTISGRVTDSSTGQSLVEPGMVVEFMDGDGDLVTGSWVGPDGPDYSAWAVPAGTYYARATDYFEAAPYIEEWYDDLPVSQNTIEDATPIAVTTADVDGIDFVLTRLAQYEQADDHIVYSPAGSWAAAFNMAASGGSYSRSSAPGSSATIYFSGTRLDWLAMSAGTAGKADVYLDGALKETVDLSDDSGPGYSARVWSTGDISDGAHKVEIRYNATNAAGAYIDVDAVNVAGSLAYGPPAINSLSPTTGTIDGGTNVTLNGYGFTGATSVTFDGAPSIFTVDSSIKITAKAPAHAVGMVQIQVTTPAGSTEDTPADDYTYAFAPVSPTEQTDSRLVYSPSASWAAFSSASASGGSYKRSSTGGAYVVIPFKGTRLDWVATKGVTMGKADVYLDGVLKETVDLAATSASYKNVVWSTGTLANGYHLVRIVRNSTSASGKYINIDRADVVGTLVTGMRTEQDDSHLIYSPSLSWLTFAKTSAYGGSYIRCSASEASVTIHFEGVRFEWIATLGTTMGTADVYLDDVKKATINLHRSTAVYKQVAWSSGFIAPGSHTVTIVRSGSSPAGKFINVDAVKIYGVLE